MIYTTKSNGFSMLEMLLVLATLGLVSSLFLSNPSAALNNSLQADKLLYSISQARRVAVQTRCPVLVSISSQEFIAAHQGQCATEAPYQEIWPFDTPLLALNFVSNENEGDLNFYNASLLSQQILFLADKTAQNINTPDSDVEIILDNRKVIILLATAVVRAEAL